jgi:hypothetical protein
MVGQTIDCPACKTQIIVPASQKKQVIRIKSRSSGALANTPRPKTKTSKTGLVVVLCVGLVIGYEVGSGRISAIRSLTGMTQAVKGFADSVGVAKQESVIEPKTQLVDLTKVIVDPAKYKDQILRSIVTLTGWMGDTYVHVVPLFTVGRTDTDYRLKPSSPEVTAKASRVGDAVGVYGHVVITYKLTSGDEQFWGHLQDIDLP